MQGPDKNMLDASDKIAVFVKKLSLWKQARSHGGAFGGSAPPNFFCAPPNFVAPRKI